MSGSGFGGTELRIDLRGSGESIDQMGFDETTSSGQASDALAGLHQDATMTALPWSAEVMLIQPFCEEPNTTEPVAADSHYVGSLQVVAGNGAPALDDAIAESVDWFVETLQ